LARVANPFLIHVLTIVGFAMRFLTKPGEELANVLANVSRHQLQLKNHQYPMPIGYSMATVVSANLPIVSALVIIGYQISHA
jgi:hypothetical protein